MPWQVGLHRNIACCWPFDQKGHWGTAPRLGLTTAVCGVQHMVFLVTSFQLPGICFTAAASYLLGLPNPNQVHF